MTLYLEKCGCNFFKGDIVNALSDVGNYRVCTGDYNILGKDGRVYFLEFTNGTKYNYRTTHKVTGEPLKQSVRELVNANALYLETCFQDTDGLYRRNRSLESKFWDMNLDYTMANILAVVNEISVDHYDSIEWIER